MLALLRYAYLLLFVGSVVEGDATLVTAGFLARRGYLRLWAVVLVAAVATTLANEFYYRVARAHAEAAFLHKADHDLRVVRVRRWVQSRGPLLLFFSRFMWGFRVAIPLACGAVSMPRSRFLVANTRGHFFGQFRSECWSTAVPPNSDRRCERHPEDSAPACPPKRDVAVWKPALSTCTCRSGTCKR
jgi:hypothetical protein